MLRSLVQAGFSLLLGSIGFASSDRTTIEVGIDSGPSTSVAPSEIPYDASQTRFEVKPLPGFIRYRLAGYESDWNERSGEMFFLVRFLDGRGDQIAQQSFLVKGKSSGWKGSEETSTATGRRETLIVPPEARNVVITISSAGPAVAAGTFAISDLRISGRKEAASPPRVLISPDIPTEWVKGGTRPSMASVRFNDSGSAIYKIIDDDITGHADWKTVANTFSQVVPGETLDLSWKESFCTGMGDPFEVQYGRLPSGAYRFEVESLGFSGMPPGDFATFEIQVASPFWRNPWYWAASVVGVAALSFLIARHLVRKKIQVHLREARMISDERLRIARDLHDDLGARLSHISLIGAHAMSSAPNPQVQQTFGEITSMSRELVTSLSESVWMLSSKNDHLDSLTDYLCRMVGGLCGPLEIRCRIEAPSPSHDDIAVTGEFRHHVTMAVKEAVNNALKHSGCTEIRLKIGIDHSFLEIQIADNGKGLGEFVGSGNGLENIKQRMIQIGGSVKMGAAEVTGTVVHLRAPFRNINGQASRNQ